MISIRFARIWLSCPFQPVVALAAMLVLVSSGSAAEINWQPRSSTRGELPVPGESTQQTGAIVFDFDQNHINDFVLSFRKVAPEAPPKEWTGAGCAAKEKIP